MKRGVSGRSPRAESTEEGVGLPLTGTGSFSVSATRHSGHETITSGLAMRRVRSSSSTIWSTEVPKVGVSWVGVLLQVTMRNRSVQPRDIQSVPSPTSRGVVVLLT